MLTEVKKAMHEQSENFNKKYKKVPSRNHRDKYLNKNSNTGIQQYTR